MTANSPVVLSSRRRHTRLQGDWSSDVCSSDLEPPVPPLIVEDGLEQVTPRDVGPEDRRDVQLGVGELPQQEIGEPAFTGRPDQQVRVSNRSEEHTSELQSPCNLVCRLLLEKKKQ